MQTKYLAMILCYGLAVIGLGDIHAMDCQRVSSEYNKILNNPDICYFTKEYEKADKDACNDFYNKKEVDIYELTLIEKKATHRKSQHSWSSPYSDIISEQSETTEYEENDVSELVKKAKDEIRKQLEGEIKLSHSQFKNTLIHIIWTAKKAKSDCSQTARCMALLDRIISLSTISDYEFNPYTIIDKYMSIPIDKESLGKRFCMLVQEGRNILNNDKDSQWKREKIIFEEAVKRHLKNIKINTVKLEKVPLTRDCDKARLDYWMEGYDKIDPVVTRVLFGAYQGCLEHEKNIRVKY
jgi:hypothetical protein